VVATSVTATKAITALERVRGVVEQYGTEEQRARLHEVMGGSVPAPNRAPIEHSAYVSEALAILAEMVVELKETTAPKKRGRPPKAKPEAAA
jgi:hypothetical protein